jgi:hypothetical protein
VYMLQHHSRFLQHQTGHQSEQLASTASLVGSTVQPKAGPSAPAALI